MPDIDNPDLNETPPEHQNTQMQDNPTPEEQRAGFFVDDLDSKLNDENVKTAIIIIMDPKLRQPIIYTRGGTYQVLNALVGVARLYKNKLDEELRV